MEKYIPELEQKKAELELEEKIGDAVVEGAFTGYKVIENAAVSGFNKVSDKFVGAFLTKRESP